MGGLFKTAFRLVSVPVIVAIWLVTLAAIGVEIQFSDGSGVRLHGWLKDIS